MGVSKCAPLRAGDLCDHWFSEDIDLFQPLRWVAVSAIVILAFTIAIQCRRVFTSSKIFRSTAQFLLGSTYTYKLHTQEILTLCILLNCFAFAVYCVDPEGWSGVLPIEAVVLLQDWLNAVDLVLIITILASWMKAVLPFSETEKQCYRIGIVLIFCVIMCCSAVELISGKDAQQSPWVVFSLKQLLVSAMYLALTVGNFVFVRCIVLVVRVIDEPLQNGPESLPTIAQIVRKISVMRPRSSLGKSTSKAVKSSSLNAQAGAQSNTFLTVTADDKNWVGDSNTEIASSSFSSSVRHADTEVNGTLNRNTNEAVAGTDHQSTQPTQLGIANTDTTINEVIRFNDTQRNSNANNASCSGGRQHTSENQETHVDVDGDGEGGGEAAKRGRDGNEVRRTSGHAITTNSSAALAATRITNRKLSHSSQSERCAVRMLTIGSILSDICESSSNSRLDCDPVSATMLQRNESVIVSRNSIDSSDAIRSHINNNNSSDQNNHDDDNQANHRDDSTGAYDESQKPNQTASEKEKIDLLAISEHNNDLGSSSDAVPPVITINVMNHMNHPHVTKVISTHNAESQGKMASSISESTSMLFAVNDQTINHNHNDKQHDQVGDRIHSKQLAKSERNHNKLNNTNSIGEEAVSTNQSQGLDTQTADSTFTFQTVTAPSITKFDQVRVFRSGPSGNIEQRLVVFGLILGTLTTAVAVFTLLTAVRALIDREIFSFSATNSNFVLQSLVVMLQYLVNCVTLFYFWKPKRIRHSQDDSRAQIQNQIRSRRQRKSRKNKNNVWDVHSVQKNKRKSALSPSAMADTSANSRLSSNTPVSTSISSRDPQHNTGNVSLHSVDPQNSQLTLPSLAAPVSLPLPLRLPPLNAIHTLSSYSTQSPPSFHNMDSSYSSILNNNDNSGGGELISVFPTVSVLPSANMDGGGSSEIDLPGQPTAAASSSSSSSSSLSVELFPPTLG